MQSKSSLQAKSLQFLDVSQNALDKKAIEYIAAALPAAPAIGLASLRLDDCSLKPQALDALGKYTSRFRLGHCLASCSALCTGVIVEEYLAST